MRTYGEIFRVPQLRPLFASVTLQVAASTVSGLALGTYVYGATGSPLLSALAMFGPSLAQLAGASLLLSAADRLPPRAVLTLTGLAAGAGTLAQAVPGIGLGAVFAITVSLGIIAPLASGARYGLLTEILPPEGYLLGRAVFNMANGLLQVCGFAAGGLAVAFLSARGTLALGGALWVTGAAVTWLGLRPRPARVSGRASVAATWRANRALWASVTRRYVLLALWVPNGLIVGCEAVFVAYSPAHAGLLYAFAALGMLAGDTVVGRFTPARWRMRLGPWLRLLLAVPYLAFALHPALPVAMAAACAASVGYAASLLLTERLARLVPDELSGHAMGLQSSGMMVMQGAGAALAGAVAQWTSPATAMVAMAVASIAVTLLLAPGLREAPAAAGDADAAGGAPGHLALPVPDPVAGTGSRPEAAGGA
ncbi:MAG TPA: MFS transporter [Trebonia sp.]|nr:MFS transporter [Trebonia sp.]